MKITIKTKEEKAKIKSKQIISISPNPFEPKSYIAISDISDTGYVQTKPQTSQTISLSFIKSKKSEQFEFLECMLNSTKLKLTIKKDSREVKFCAKITDLSEGDSITRLHLIVC